MTITEFKNIVTESGALLMRIRENAYKTSTKTSYRDLVTVCDVQVQNFLIERFRLLLPNAAFIAEEMQNSDRLDSGDLIIIDPIDGTANFVHGIPYCAISAAWYKNGMPFYGIVYNPFTNDIFEAQAGEGAYKNGKKIRISDAPLMQSIIAFGTSPYNEESEDETFELIRSIYHKCQDIRRFGSAALDICHTAEGCLGLYFEMKLSLWDYAAAIIILREAGGCACDIHGNELGLNLPKTSVIVGSAANIAESRLIIRGEEI